jgi:hypothetical protein
LITSPWLGMEGSSAAGRIERNDASQPQTWSSRGRSHPAGDIESRHSWHNQVAEAGQRPHDPRSEARMTAKSLASSAQTSAVSRPLIPNLPFAPELLPYLRRLDEVRWYSNFGPLECRFEERPRRLLAREDRTTDHGATYLTTLVSGHYALEVALQLLGITRGEKVLHG